MAKAKAKAKAASKMKVTLVKSSIGYAQDQRRTLQALGLRKMNESVVCEDNPAMRGQVLKVRHFVSVEEVE